MRFKFHKPNFNIFLLLLLGLVIRLVFANFGTLNLDQGTFIAWSNRLLGVGFSHFYQSWSDYLPGYLYVLWLLAKIRSLVVVDNVVLYKLPAILADVATGWLIYSIVRKVRDDRWALISLAAYLFNPAVLANSTLWGQVDSLTALFSLAAVAFASSSWAISAIFLAVGTLIKPQAAFALLPILYIFLRDKWRPGKVLMYLTLGLGFWVLGFVPFASAEPLIPFIFSRITITLDQYPYTSVNAFNFWALIGMWKQDTLGIVSYQTLGYLLSLGVIVPYSLHLLRKKIPLGEYKFLSVVMLTTYLFLTRMHERHLLPALAPLAVVFSLEPLFLAVYAGLSATYLANLRYAFVWITKDFREIFSRSTTSVLSFINLSFLGVLVLGIPRRLTVAVENLRVKAMFRGPEKLNFPRSRLSKRNLRPALIGILVFAAITRLLFLEFPPKEYFDEVYHAFTAKVMLHGDPKAWEWWNTPPEGFAYEWTHPPLAKLFMWGSMALVGENSIGWRLPSALLGVGIVFLVYLLGKEIFKDELVAVLSAAVFSLEGLPLVMSRIGMNDTYFLFFALLSLYSFIRNRNFFSAVFLGAAAASKWTAMYLLPVLAVSHFVFRGKRGFAGSNFWFLIIPPLIYLGSYVPMFVSGHTWGNFVEVQKQMWWYHTNLEATHAYTSPAFTWPFLIRGVWLYTSGESNNLVANIYAFGNPAVSWFGFAAVLLTAIDALAGKSKRLLLVVFSYLIFFAPWIVSPRIMFLYHYLPALPFLSIACGYLLRKNPKLIVPAGLVFGLMFVYFFPHWTGIKIPTWLDRTYYWLETWR